MFSPFLLLAFLGVLAGRVLAFNITVGDQNLSVSQILAIPDSLVKSACTTNCSDASSKIAACNDDASCLCRADTVASLLGCETCMFHFLIATNKPAPDFRAGSNAVLGAYAAACKSEAGVTLAANQTALLLPSSWSSETSFVAVLPVGGVAVTVIAGGILGMAAILLLSNME